MSKAIMIQGTMSNAGKSFFAAALCRIFKQDGYRCAPFKSQAAGVEPSVLRNPVLLKPTTNRGSQIIVNGKAVGNMTAAEYFRRKRCLVPKIKEAYDRLSAENDIIVVEGA